MSLLSVTLALALLALWAGIPVDGLGAWDGSGAMMSVAQAATDGRIEIHLERVTYDPLYGDPGLTDRLSLGSYSGDGLGYYVVQFGGPILSACKSNLGQAGAAVLDYVPQSNLVERNYAQPSPPCWTMYRRATWWSATMPSLRRISCSRRRRA